MPQSRVRAEAKVNKPEPVSLNLLTEAPRMFLTQSARAALVGLDAFEANFQIWQAVGSAMREMGKRQQDAALRGVRERLSASSGEAIASVDGMSAPFEAARAGCEKGGDAVLAAQRRTPEGITEAASASKSH